MPHDDPTGGGYQVVVVEEDVEIDDVESVLQTERDEFLRLAHMRFHTVVSAEAELRKNMLEDLKFRASEQWPEQVKTMRNADSRPCLTVNRIPQFIRQVTNNQRASRPAIAVNPTGDDADQDVAEVIQGVVRHIENKSDADVAYSTAGDHQATMGRGYIRVITDYVDDDPLDLNQEIRIERVGNPFSVYMDPSAQKPDGSDARYGFVVEDLPKDEYTFRYPLSDLVNLSEFTSSGNQQAEWMPEGSVRIAEYFYVEETREQVVILLMPDGSKQKVPRETYADVTALPEGVTLLAEREVTNRAVKWALINGAEILEGDALKVGGLDWPGKYIPLVPVLGDEININGVKDYRGIVRDAKDPQRMYNYWVSAETEMIALAPRAPFVAAEGQFEGHEAKWENANVRNFPYLEYKPKTFSGQLAPPPQRQSWEPPIQAMTMAIAQSDNDLKSTGGFNDASLGVRGPQESGKALRTRQQQDEMANSHYLDNLGRAIRQVGRIVVDLLPNIYDIARVIRIVGDDEKRRNVMVFAGAENAPSDVDVEQMPPGIEGIYNLGVGRYDVSVSVGPSFQTRRQEAVDSLVQFVQAYPNAFPMIGDLLAENMDWPGSKQVAARLKKMLPPQLQDDVDQRDIPPEVQARMQQIDGQLKQIQKAYQQAQEALRTDQVKRQAQVAIKERELAADAAAQERDLQARLQLEQIKQQGESSRALAKIEQQRASEILQTEIGRLEQLISRNVEISNRQEDRYERIAMMPPVDAPPQAGPRGVPQGVPAGGPPGVPPGVPPGGPQGVVPGGPPGVAPPLPEDI
tara:strand:- start:5874 stop:8279 length:2406 start_codon:yes stop_codon:yes gene_type:complete